MSCLPKVGRDRSGPAYALSSLEAENEGYFWTRTAASITELGAPARCIAPARVRGATACAGHRRSAPSRPWVQPEQRGSITVDQVVWSREVTAVSGQACLRQAPDAASGGEEGMSGST